MFSRRFTPIPLSSKNLSILTLFERLFFHLFLWVPFGFFLPVDIGEAFFFKNFRCMVNSFRTTSHVFFSTVVCFIRIVSGLLGDVYLFPQQLYHPRFSLRRLHAYDVWGTIHHRHQQLLPSLPIYIFISTHLPDFPIATPSPINLCYLCTTTRLSKCILVNEETRWAGIRLSSRSVF